MSSVVPGSLRRDARPPMSMDAAPSPGTAEEQTPVRPTAVPRPWLTPRLVGSDGGGHSPDDPVVRRYWTALVGPGAVADLLRLIVAARRGERLRRPVHLAVLLHEGLVGRDGERILVREEVPRLGPRQVRRLHPTLRGEYLRLYAIA